MGFFVGRHEYYLESSRMRTQVGVLFLGCAVRFFNVANQNPLAAGLAIQAFGRMVPLLEKRFKTPPEVVKFAITGVIICTSYTLASQLDERIQAICFLALLFLDANKIGHQNVWQELKSER